MKFYTSRAYYQSILKKDQDILEAIYLDREIMDALKSLRDTRSDKTLSTIFSFYQKNNTNIVDMTKNYVTLRGRRTKVTN